MAEDKKEGVAALVASAKGDGRRTTVSGTALGAVRDTATPRGGADGAPAAADEDDEQDDTGFVVKLVTQQLHAFIDNDLDAANGVAHPAYKVKPEMFDQMMRDQFTLFGKDAGISYVENTYVKSPPGPPHFMAEFCLVEVKQRGGIGMVDYVKCQKDRKTDMKWTVAEWQQDPPEEQSP